VTHAYAYKIKKKIKNLKKVFRLSRRIPLQKKCVTKRMLYESKYFNKVIFVFAEYD